MAPSPAADGERLEAKFDALSTQVEELTKAVNTVLKLQEAQVKGEAQVTLARRSQPSRRCHRHVTRCHMVSRLQRPQQPCLLAQRGCDRPQTRT